MKTKTSTSTYLLTFNINIYAQPNNPQLAGDFIENHNGQQTIQYKKGDTLEVSEEAFNSLVKYGGMANQSTVQFTGQPCIVRFKTKDIESVAKKQVWMEISNHRL
tara:strand:- start:940 stop:1254 length:315 start_codon:yes stop_codon:yes gene_type:complete